jgi:protein disulfide-isomerase A1
MRTFTTVALGLLGAAVASASDVASLTKDTFPDFVKANDLVLAECKSPSAAAQLNPY